MAERAMALFCVYSIFSLQLDVKSFSIFFTEAKLLRLNYSKTQKKFIIRQIFPFLHPEIDIYICIYIGACVSV